jgi:hypothetical protein
VCIHYHGNDLGERNQPRLSVFIHLLGKIPSLMAVNEMTDQGSPLGKRKVIKIFDAVWF